MTSRQLLFAFFLRNTIYKILKTATMGLFDNLLGNASEIDPNEILREYNEILFTGEQLNSAFKVFRDKWVFTNKRLIIQNTQGITGKKREYHSIPYQSINHFSIETAGTFDTDCEIKLWVKGLSEPIIKEFSSKTDVKKLQQTLAYHITK
jgi:hypothetical protein